MSNSHQLQKQRLQLIAHEWVEAQPIVAAYISSLVRDVHDREDLIQQTAYYLLEHADDYAGDGSLVRWAIGVARYRVLEYRQKRASDRRFLSTENIDLLTESFAQISEDHQKQRDQRLALEQCIDALPGRHRKVLQLRYISSCAVHQIASQLGVTANVISVLLHRVRTALAQCIARKIQESA